MKSKLIVWMIMMAVASVANAQDTKLTLQKSIETALANSIPAQQSQLTMNSAEINYKQAKYNRLPSVEGSFNYGMNSGRSIDPFTNGYINQQLSSSSANGQAVLPVFNGFQLKNQIKQNEYAFATATMEWQQKKDELTLQVILAFLQIMNNEDGLLIATQQASVTRQQVDRLEIIAKEGATLPGNVSDLKGQYAGDELAIVNAENNLETSVLALTQLMNVPYDANLKVDRSGFDSVIKMYDAMPNDIYTTALQQLASVKASELRIKSSSMAVKVAAANYYPTVSLYGVLNTNYSSAASINNFNGFVEVPNGDYVNINGAPVPVITKQNKYTSQKIGYGSQFNNNLSTAYGVSVRIPIFNSFKTRSAVRLAKNEEKNNQLIADNIKLQLRQSVEQAYINITTTYKRYMALLNQLDAYKESFRIAALRFENGAINSAEYLIAKNNVDQTNANSVAARYEYLLRTKVLDFYMGRLK
ncbi:MAG: TolC family protein [Ferruginibacter sp.]